MKSIDMINAELFENPLVADKFCRLFGIILVWLSTVTVIYIKGMNYVLSESAVFLPLGLVVVVAALGTAAKFESVEKTIDYLNLIRMSHKEPWELNIMNSEMTNATKMIDLLKKFLYIFAVFYVLAPVIIDLVRAHLGYENPYKVALPLDGYLDERLVRNLKYFSLMFLSHFWFALIVLNNIAFQGLILYFVSSAIGEMKIIKMKCESLSGNSNIFTNDRYAKNDWNLKEVITNHQMLLRLIHYQKKCIGLQLTMQNTVSTLSNCLIMYLINNSYGTDKILFMFCVLFMTFTVVLLGTICNQGESIQTQNEEMFLSFCHTPWYNQKPKIRRDINLMIMQARKSLVYDYRGQSPVNRAAFMLIINGSYSYFMLIKSFE